MKLVLYVKEECLLKLYLHLMRGFSFFHSISSLHIQIPTYTFINLLQNSPLLDLC